MWQHKIPGRPAKENWQECSLVLLILQDLLCDTITAEGVCCCCCCYKGGDSVLYEKNKKRSTEQANSDLNFLFNHPQGQIS